MLKDLLEGIIVPPTVGGRDTPGGQTQRLELPEVVGTTITAQWTDPRTLEVEVAFLDVNGFTDTLAGDPDNKVSVPRERGNGRVRDEFPLIEFNIGDYMKVEGFEPPYDISMISVDEYKWNRKGTTYDENNPYITMDENGNVRYTPRGFFQNNTLRIQIELAAGGVEPTQIAKAASAVYRPFGVVVDGHTSGSDEQATIFPKDKIFDRHKEEYVTVSLTDTVIGRSREEVDDFHLFQGMNGTCYIVSAGMLLKEQGFTNPTTGEPLTYEDIVNLFAIEIDPKTGEIIGDPPPVTDEKGAAAYVKWKDPDTGEIRTQWGRNRNGNNIRGTEIPLVADPRIDTEGFGFLNGLQKVFPNLEIQSGQAMTPDLIIAKLAAGESMSISVDDNELDYAPALKELINSGYTTAPGFPDIDLSFTSNHQVVVHGVQTDTDGSVYVVVNDPNNLFDESRTGTRPGTSLVPFQTFLAAAEDTNMYYKSFKRRDATDPQPTYNGKTAQQIAQERTLLNASLYQSALQGTSNISGFTTFFEGGGYERSWTVREVISRTLKDPDRLEEIKMSDPPFYMRLIEHQKDTKAMRKALKEKYPNVDFDKVDKDWQEVDFEFQEVPE